MNNRSKNLNIPNLLSLLRLMLIPVYVYTYQAAVTGFQYALSGGILAFSCLTDMIDGKIARKFNQITTLGKILDPLADKATQFALTLCLSLRYSVLRWVLGLLAVKELFQLVAALVFLRRGKMLDGAIFAGKICTTVLFVSLILLVLFPGLPTRVVDGIAATDCIFLLIAFTGYLLAYFGGKMQLKEIPANKSTS